MAIKNLYLFLMTMSLFVDQTRACPCTKTCMLKYLIQDTYIPSRDDIQGAAISNVTNMGSMGAILGDDDRMLPSDSIVIDSDPTSVPPSNFTLLQNYYMIQQNSSVDTIPSNKTYLFDKPVKMLLDPQIGSGSVGIITKQAVNAVSSWSDYDNIVEVDAIVCPCTKCTSLLALSPDGPENKEEDTSLLANDLIYPDTPYRKSSESDQPPPSATVVEEVHQTADHEHNESSNDDNVIRSAVSDAVYDAGDWIKDAAYDVGDAIKSAARELIDFVG